MRMASDLVADDTAEKDEDHDVNPIQVGVADIAARKAAAA
jgi:hypothetical protein